MKPSSVLSLTVILLALGRAPQAAPLAPGTTSERVGRAGTNRTVLPVNQVVTPFGRQVELPGLRPQVIARPTFSVVEPGSPGAEWSGTSKETASEAVSRDFIGQRYRLGNHTRRQGRSRDGTVNYLPGAGIHGNAPNQAGATVIFLCTRG